MDLLVDRLKPIKAEIAKLDFQNSKEIVQHPETKWPGCLR